jgi:hypothetical protein
LSDLSSGVGFLCLFGLWWGSYFAILSLEVKSFLVRLSLGVESSFASFELAANENYCIFDGAIQSRLGRVVELLLHGISVGNSIFL